MTDPEFFALALRRIARFMAALAAGGIAAALAMGGWRAAGGFALGGAVSWLNFRWLKRAVDALGATAAGGPKKRAAILFGLRYLILGLGAYVILRFSALSLPALFGGIFLAVAAVLVEILFELMYARE